jgi:sarcosine oxidase
LFDPLGGIIDPIAFIEAQNHYAMSLCSTPETLRNGDGVRFEVLSDVAAKIRTKNGITDIELASGKIMTAKEQIILCGGAYSGALLDDSGIESTASELPSLRASKRTVALLEVNAESVEGILRNMPTIKYAFGLMEESTVKPEAKCGGEHSRVEAGSVYILPPVCYPEKGGKWFVKIGGGPNDFFRDEGVASKAELDDWLSSQGDPAASEWLGDIGRSLLPGIRFESRRSMACVTSTTTAPKSNGVVLNDVLGDGSMVAVSACQGKGAGPSDALGADIVRRMF